MFAGYRRYTDGVLMEMIMSKEVFFSCPDSTGESCFLLLEFNVRRFGRGVEAARVRVSSDGDWMWMSPKDVIDNMRAFGVHHELLKAYGCYIEAQAGRLRDSVVPSFKPALLKDMTEPELNAHMSLQMRFVRSCQTPDTIGSMLVVFCDNGISQYASTIHPETAPQALRELADRIERRDTVTR